MTFGVKLYSRVVQLKSGTLLNFIQNKKGFNLPETFYLLMIAKVRLILETRKSAFKNNHIDCERANEEIYEKLHMAHMLIAELGDSINSVDADTLVGYIRKAWDKKVDTKNREDVDDGITLSQWGKVIIDRKLKSNKPGTASWYTGAIRSITKLNGGRDLRLNEITVTLLTNFQIEHKAKSTSKNGNSYYLRAVRAIYYSAIKEDQFYPKKNPFQHYKIPTSRRTK